MVGVTKGETRSFDCSSFAALGPLGKLSEIITFRCQDLGRLLQAVPAPSSSCVLLVWATLFSLLLGATMFLGFWLFCVFCTTSIFEQGESYRGRGFRALLHAACFSGSGVACLRLQLGKRHERLPKSGSCLGVSLLPKGVHFSGVFWDYAPV